MTITVTVNHHVFLWKGQGVINTPWLWIYRKDSDQRYITTWIIEELGKQVRTIPQIVIDKNI